MNTTCDLKSGKSEIIHSTGNSSVFLKSMTTALLAYCKEQTEESDDMCQKNQDPYHFATRNIADFPLNV